MSSHSKFPIKSYKNKQPKVPSNLEIREMIKSELKDEIDKVKSDYAKTLMKLLCLSLNETYHFGKVRCLIVLQSLGDLVEEEMKSVDQDGDIFWSHVNGRLNQIGVLEFIDKEVTSGSSS